MVGNVPRGPAEARQTADAMTIGKAKSQRRGVSTPATGRAGREARRRGVGLESRPGRGSGRRSVGRSRGGLGGNALARPGGDPGRPPPPPGPRARGRRADQLHQRGRRARAGRRASRGQLVGLRPQRPGGRLGAGEPAGDRLLRQPAGSAAGARRRGLRPRLRDLRVVALRPRRGAAQGGTAWGRQYGKGSLARAE